MEPDEIVGGSIHLYEIGQHPDVQIGLAETYRRHRLGDEEINALERALAKRTFATDARKRLTAIYEGRGDVAAAERVIMRSPNPDPTEIAHVVRLKRAQGKTREAHELIETAVRTGFPNDMFLKNEYAWFMQELEVDLEPALVEIDRAVEWSPDDVAYRDTRAMVQLKRGEPELALEDVDHALSRPDGDVADVHWHRALVLEALGRRSAADSTARAVLDREDLSDETFGAIHAWLEARGW